MQEIQQEVKIERSADDKQSQVAKNGSRYAKDTSGNDIGSGKGDKTATIDIDDTKAAGRGGWHAADCVAHSRLRLLVSVIL